MLAGLRQEASAFVDQPVTTAAISIPDLVALYGEDAVDSFEYLSLENLEYANFKEFNPIHSASSVYITYDRQILPCVPLSSNSEYPAKGVRPTPPPHGIKESNFHAVTVSYTHSELVVGMALFSGCYGLQYGDMFDGTADMELGFDARGKGKYGDRPYWEEVKYTINSTIISYYDWIAKVILWGDAVGEVEFQKSLREVLDEVLVDKNPEFLGLEDPLYMGARGTAEFARRALIEKIKLGSKLQEQEEL
jgi:hypothetical protein